MIEKLNSQQIAELEEILDLARMTEQQAREMCELSTMIAWKYQKHIKNKLQSTENNISKF